MQLIQQYITKNPCYKAGETIKPKGIMVHSTATPGVMAKSWFDRWNNTATQKAVHAFVDDRVTCQHLPWNHRAWHAAGAANNTHIAFEICEPKDWKTDEEYFKKAYQNAVELTAFLCKQYALTSQTVISHKEGSERGIASNHGDPDHWWRYFGYTMEQFRSDVKKAMAGEPVQVQVYRENPVLQSGDTGAYVVHLQGLLNLAKQRLRLSFAKLETDGIFGVKTLWAVKEFQVARNLTVDGIVGKNTWKALNIRYGDLNGDQKADAKDALQVLRSTVGKQTLTQGQQAAADLTGDGKVNARDALEILKAATGGK